MGKTKIWEHPDGISRRVEEHTELYNFTLKVIKSDRCSYKRDYDMEYDYVRSGISPCCRPL